MRLIEKLTLLESVTYKYIEMKKDTEKFNKYLQNQLEKSANEEETNNT